MYLWAAWYNTRFLIAELMQKGVVFSFLDHVQKIPRPALVMAIASCLTLSSLSHLLSDGNNTRVLVTCVALWMLHDDTCMYSIM